MSDNNNNKRALFESMAQLQGKAVRRRSRSTGHRRRKEASSQTSDAIQNKRFTRRTLLLGAGGFGLFGLLAGKAP